VPLYATDGATRPPRSEIAEVVGPLGKVDGRDVLDQGGWFELRPGCHVVELDPRPPTDSSLSSPMYFTGQFSVTTYVLRMKAGARYVIRRNVITGSHQGRITLSALEEAAGGATTELAPMQTVDEIQACKEWAATAVGR